ncbi:MAG: thioredoxin family protein [Tenericutes bacterium]|nr:thioredoxin family protein [Mycoplasmatota bacterium]
MNIKVLGSGCKNCIRLEKNVLDAINSLGKVATVEHVTDYSDIVSYGVMSTPALVVDGKVLFSGRVPSPKQLMELLG